MCRLEIEKQCKNIGNSDLSRHIISVLAVFVEKSFGISSPNDDTVHPFWTKNEESQSGAIADHPAWDIIIGKVDFQSQMKISQLSRRLADAVDLNAESELQKFQRHIREDKYM